MKYRVLFVASTLERSGVTNVIFNIIKYLDRNQFEPVILTLSPEPLDSKMNDFLSLQIEVRSLGKSRISWILSPHRSLKKAIDNLQIDIIHSHSFRADASVSRYTAIYPIVSTIHSNLYDNYKDLFGAVVGKFLEKKQLRCLSEIDATIACSKSVWNKYRSNLSNLHFIQNGIDTTIFYSASDKKNLRNQLKLPMDKKIFVSVGSLIKRKNPETVITGFLKSNEATKSLLLLVGSGDLLNSLKKKYYELSNVVFVGQQQNVIDYLRSADFFISASLSEGLPNAVLEALACSLPVFISDIPSHREVLEGNPNAGILFPTNSPAMLSHCLNNFNYEKTEESRRAAQEIIRHGLNAELMTKQYEGVYMNVIQQKQTKHQ